MRQTLLGGVVAALCGAAVVAGQAPARQGPSLQGPQDPRYAALIAQCKTPPPAPAARGGGPAAGQGRGAAPAPNTPREYTVAEIPGVVAAGARWTKLWETDGNNADGIVGTDDGGLLVAQNDNSRVIKLDRAGKESVAYTDTNTGGALSFNTKGALFIVERALNASVWQLAPQRKLLANRIQGDPLDCLGGVINDLTADSKGGVYFTMGGVFHADPQGTVTRYGQGLRTNGVLLSRDEKTLFVTNGQSVAAFDVQPSGALTNQREFVAFQGGGGDGMAVDAEGRLYVTGASGVQVVGADGKYLGLIPTPQGVITTAFSGADKKSLFAVVSLRNGDARSAQIISIPTIAQGFRGRAK
jgi:sugar lactone lactonase YvrE